MVIDLDENDMITKLEDKWDGKDLPSRFGTLVSLAYDIFVSTWLTSVSKPQYLRRMNAKVLPWLVKVPELKK